MNILGYYDRRKRGNAQICRGIFVSSLKESALHPGAQNWGACMPVNIEEWSQGANYTLDRMVRYNGVVFRGLKYGCGPELRKELMSAYKSGKPWVNNASCSTSMKLSVAESFDGDTILIIHNKTGAYIHEISDFNKEFEIMTLRGTKYKKYLYPQHLWAHAIM